MKEGIDKYRKASIGVDTYRDLSIPIGIYDSPFSRSEALLGEAAMKRLAAAHVLLVGVGGVGSWCAEALVRTGLGHLTLVDDDTVVESNLNRQCPATTATLGRPKVEAMRERLLAINSQADVIARFERFRGAAADARQDDGDSRCVRGCNSANCTDSQGCAFHGNAPTDRVTASQSSTFGFESFDLIIDAIDSVDCKAELILRATEAGVPLVSSMGAALRTDPTKVRVTRFEKVEGDGLAKALRRRFKKLQRFPAAKFNCVWSGEQLLNTEDQRNGEEQKGSDSLILSVKKTKGSLMTVTATFGMCLASEAIREITSRFAL